MPKFSLDQREHGDAIVERLQAAKLKGDAKKSAILFKTTHGSLAEASEAALEARVARDGALVAVSNADRTLDAQLQRLADKLVGEGLGKRTNPFTAFGSTSPSEICGLPYAKQAVEVRKLVRAIERTKPRAPVARALEQVGAASADLEKALARLEKPQAQYTRALARRDAILPSWQKALDRTRILARADLVDDPVGYKALFAPPGARPKRRKAKRKSAQPSV